MSGVAQQVARVPGSPGGWVEVERTQGVLRWRLQVLNRWLAFLKGQSHTILLKLIPLLSQWGFGRNKNHWPARVLPSRQTSLTAGDSA